MEMQHPREKIINRRKSPIAVTMAQCRILNESCHDSCNPISLQLALTPLTRDIKCGSQSNDYATIFRQGRTCYIISQYQYSPFLTSQGFPCPLLKKARKREFVPPISAYHYLQEKCQTFPFKCKAAVVALGQALFSLGFASPNRHPFEGAAPRLNLYLCHSVQITLQISQIVQLHCNRSLAILGLTSRLVGFQNCLPEHQKYNLL